MTKEQAPLQSFIGIPFKFGNRFLGMCGLANKRDGYTEETARALKPICDFIATLINSSALERAKEILNRDISQKY